MTGIEHLPPPPPGRVSRKQLALPAVLALAMVIAIGTVIVLAQRSGDTGAPPQPPPFATPAPAESVFLVTVQQIENGQPRFARADGGGAVDLEIPASATVELLRRAEFTGVSVGDWVVAAGIPNRVRNFVVRELIVFPGPVEAVPGGFARTPAGFFGHEAVSDADAEPVVGGVVTEVSADRLVFDTGYALVEVTPGDEGPVPLRILEPGSVDDLIPGARIAVPAVGGQPDPNATSVLVALP